MRKAKIGLKCPFCGNDVHAWDTGGQAGVVSVVECGTCQVRFVMPWGRKGTELYDWWNSRCPKNDPQPYDGLKNKNLWALENGYD